MNFELIAFDIDGTLTESKAPIEDNPAIDTDMSDLLNKLLSKYKVAIISGASFKQFDTQILAHLTKDAELLKNLYLLPTNGTTICTNENNIWQCPETNALTAEEKDKIRFAFEEMFKEIGYKKPEETYGEVFEDRLSQITFSALGQSAPLEIKQGWDSDHAKREVMVNSVAKFMPEFAAHIGGTTSIDVTRKGIDKAYGLRELLKKLAINKDKLVYVGDELFPNGNDAPALEVAGVTKSVKTLEDTKKVISELLAGN